MRFRLVLCVLLNILFVVCSAEIEINESTSTNNVEKISEGTVVKTAASSNTPSYAETKTVASSNAPSHSETKTAASSNTQSYVVAPSFFSSDFWRSGLGQTLSIGGIITATVAVFGGLIWLFAPFFGLRMCNIFGNCERSAIAYNSGGNLQDPNLQAGAMNDAQYNINPYNNIQSYYKRSVDVVGPIIKKLASTVDKIEKITDTKGATS